MMGIAQALRTERLMREGKEFASLNRAEKTKAIEADRAEKLGLTEDERKPKPPI